MRGRRFGRPVAKKKSARDRREQQQASMFYVESSQIDPSQIRSTMLNQLDHLGNQRFVLPPFSEHFRRWMKDVTTVLSDFESQLPAAVDDKYKQGIEKTMSNLRLALQERTETENTISSKRSDVQRQLAAYESELSKLDHDYKTRTHEIRRRHEQSLEKLRHEIGILDEERLKILHTKPTLLQKLFHRSEANIEETTNALRSKKNALGERKESFEQDMEKQRIQYEKRRGLVDEQLGALRAQLERSKEIRLDDALDIRKAACEELRRAVIDSSQRLFQEQDAGKSEGNE